jgi:hypothetical protein
VVLPFSLLVALGGLAAVKVMEGADPDGEPNLGVHWHAPYQVLDLRRAAAKLPRRVAVNDRELDDWTEHTPADGDRIVITFRPGTLTNWQARRY